MASDREDGVERDRVARCLAGDPAAWDALAREHAPPLSRAISRTLRAYGAPDDGPTVDDLLQETFAQIVRDDFAALRRFRWQCPLSPYLITLAVSRTVDHLRRAGLERVVLDDKRRSEASRLGQEPGRGASAEAADQARRLSAALDRLPVSERAAVRMFYWDGASHAQIARLLGLSAGYARLLLFRARGRLKGMLRDRLPSL